MEGWWDGYARESNRAGIFPANYVTHLEPKPAKPPKPPKSSTAKVPADASNIVFLDADTTTHHSSAPPPSLSSTAASDGGAMVVKKRVTMQTVGGDNPMTVKEGPAIGGGGGGGGGGGEDGAQFNGQYPQEYALWGHYLALSSAGISFVCGIFAAIWDANAIGWRCRIHREVSPSILQAQLAWHESKSYLLVSHHADALHVPFFFSFLPPPQ